MLHYQTVSSELLTLLQTLMQKNYLADFRLVGGTALSLQIGHRVSIDIDLFTEKPFEVTEIISSIQQDFPRSILQFKNQNGVSFEINNVKVDCYNWNVPFIRPSLNEDNLKLSSLEDICAFKLDAVTSRKEVKDFWDIAILLSHFTLSEMEHFYAQKYPYNNFKMVLSALSEHDKVQFIPLKSLSLETWKNYNTLIDNTLKEYFDKKTSLKLEELQAKEDKIKALIDLKNKKKQKLP